MLSIHQDLQFSSTACPATTSPHFMFILCLPVFPFLCLRPSVVFISFTSLCLCSASIGCSDCQGLNVGVYLCAAHTVCIPILLCRCWLLRGKSQQGWAITFLRSRTNIVVFSSVCNSSFLHGKWDKQIYKQSLNNTVV